MILFRRPLLKSISTWICTYAHMQKEKSHLFHNVLRRTTSSWNKVVLSCIEIMCNARSEDLNEEAKQKQW
jgi:hypothetical protein